MTHLSEENNTGVKLMTLAAELIRREISDYRWLYLCYLQFSKAKEQHLDHFIAFYSGSAVV